MGPAPSCRCQEQQLLITDWQRRNGQLKAAWILAAVFLGTVFTAKAQRTLGTSPCRVLGGLQSSTGEREGFVGCSLAFFHTNQVTVINSSVTSNHVPVSNALTGANLNVFHLKSEPKKSL